MSIRSIRFSKKVRNQLGRLKRKTGIPTYNVLCRWALCHSLSGSTIQRTQEKKTNDTGDALIDYSSEEENALDIDWGVLGGEYCDVFVAVIKQNCLEKGIKNDSEELYNQIRQHIENGIKQLVASDDLKNIESLLFLAISEDKTSTLQTDVA